MLAVVGSTLQVINRDVPHNAKIMIRNRKVGLHPALSVIDTGFSAGKVRVSLLETPLKWWNFGRLLPYLIDPIDPHRAMGCYFI